MYTLNTPFPARLAVVCVLVSAALTWNGRADAPRTFDELMQRSEAGYKRRDELLRKSTGRARVKVLRTGTDKLPAEFERLMRSAPYDANNLAGTKGNAMEVRWYASNEYYRYDTDITSLDGVTPWGAMGVLHIATSKDVGIYYNPGDKRAYINQPPIHSIGLVNYFEFFDIHQLYRVDYRQSFWEGIRDAMSKLGRQIVAFVPQERNGVDCIYVGLSPATLSGGDGKRRHEVNTEYWFANLPDLPVLSMTSLIAHFDGDKQTGRNAWEYSATYTQSSEYPDVSILRTLHQRQEDNISFQELTCEFEDVHVGVDVPDMTFNYEGMGVPPGTEICDRRAAGPTKFYHYLPGVYVGLDRIDLAAGIAAPEEPAKSSCPEVASPPPEPTPLPPPEPLPAPAPPSSGHLSVGFLIAGACAVPLFMVLAYLVNRRAGNRLPRK